MKFQKGNIRRAGRLILVGISFTLISIILVLLGGCKKEINRGKEIPEETAKEIPKEMYCRTDSECAPASCCHPSSCVNANYKPDCNGVFCTMECASGTMDCGQGYCGCAGSKCTAVLK